MHDRVRLSALLTLVVLLLAQQAQASQQVTLHWRFEQGQRLDYRMHMSSETALPEGMGVAVTENTTAMSWEVLEVNADGDASVRLSTDRVQMRMQSPMGNIEIDSDQPSADPTAQMMTALAGTAYTVVFDSSGQVKEVLGLDDLRDALRESMGAQSNPMMDQILDQMASEEGVRNMIRQGYAAFPSDPVEPGDSWDMTFDVPVPMIGTMSSNTEMTLNGIEERDGTRIAVIGINGTMQMTPEESPDSPMAGMMELAEATTSGTMEWDIDRGRLVRTTQAMRMEMSMTPPNGERISIPMDMNLLMELVEGG
jgi:hypothetical protein